MGGLSSVTTIREWRNMAMKALISSIKVNNRIRKEISKIDELAADIKVNGLLNPVTVMSLDGGELRLLAGLRRLKAMESLGHSEIDVNIVSPVDAETELRIEISENEQREPFTFSEKMDFAKLISEIETAKAQVRMHSGKCSDGPMNHGTQGAGKSRDIIGSKIGMSGVQYDRAKYIAENAPEDIIEELDNGQRSIRSTYDELKAKEKAEKSTTEAIPEKEPANSDSKKELKKKSPKASDMDALFSKSDLEAMQRNREFNAMSPDDKIIELKRQLKEERTRAATAESELARLKELRHNDIYHRDGIIDNLRNRLIKAEARVDELEKLHTVEAG